MRQAPELGPQEQEWQLLVDAYALGELDEAGMQRLYDLLRDDEHGAVVAGLAWQSLDMRGKLRSALDPGFRDLIVDRIEQQEADGADDDNRGFIGNLLAGIGLRRSKLESVRLDVPERRRARWPLALAPLLAIALIAVVLLSGKPEPLLVESLRGDVNSNGHSIEQGSRIGSSIVQVADGGELVVAWDDGPRLRISGPASFNADHQGLSLIEGHARLHSAASAATVGLPQLRISLDAGSELVIDATRDNGTRIGLLLGSARCENVDGGMLQLEAGSWSDGRQRFAWRQAEAWQERIPPTEGDWWTCEAELRFAANDDHAEFLRDGQVILSCLPTELQAGGRSWPLAHAPRQSRRLTIRSRGAGLQLAVDGQSIPFELPPGACPDELRRSPGTTLSETRISSGPRILPAP